MPMSAVSGAQVTPYTPELRAAYHASGLTIGQIAARAEVNERSVLRLLHGHQVRTGTLTKVARVLNVQSVTLWCSSVTTYSGYGA